MSLSHMTDAFMERINIVRHTQEVCHAKMKAELEVSDMGQREKYEMPGERWETDPLPAFRRTNHAHKLTLEFYPTELWDKFPF